MDRFRLAVAASFPAETIAEPLEFWLAETQLPVDVAFAPTNQLFQELLDERSMLSANRNGVNAVLAQPGSWDPDELAAAVATCAARTGVPHLVVCCPGQRDRAARPGDTGGDRDQRRLSESLDGNGRVTVVTEQELRDRYPVAAPYDSFHRTARQDAEAPLPYGPAMAAALATMVARATHAWLTPRPKVIVVDADGTLWDGVVGEEGVSGVHIGPARQAIHEMLLAQRAAGRLLAVCSANIESDVIEVLDKHPDSLLRTEHLTAHRINWRPKAENLTSIAQRLSLGLDSFVFIDDNPMECARMRADHEDVLVLELPAEAVTAAAFLRHCWPLDITPATEDDVRRAQRYRVEQARQDARARTASLADFLKALDLRVTVQPLTARDLTRSAQLTQRTNQFNLTARRRTVADLQALAAAGDLRCLVVTARDRFGDYGQVGVVVIAEDAEAVRLETFLLSCRVLGRGVEHRVLAEVGRRALEADRRWVDLPFTPTDRNQPALDFLRSLLATVSADPHESGRQTYRVSAEDASRARYQPSHEAIEGDTRANAKIPSPRSPSDQGARVVARSELIQRIATDLSSPQRVLAAAEAYALTRRRASGWPDPVQPVVPTDDPTEAAVARIWCQLLDFAPSSVHDDFYSLGGDSLLVIRFARQVLVEFGVELPLDDLFTVDFTIADTARRIRRHTQAQTPAGADAGR